MKMDWEELTYKVAKVRYMLYSNIERQQYYGYRAPNVVIDPRTNKIISLVSDRLLDTVTEMENFPFGDFTEVERRRSL